MNLTDIMGASGLELWAELGLVVSFATFMALVVWLFIVRRGRRFEHESHLPLDDEPTSDIAASSPTAFPVASEERNNP